jgi:hypothetical protein
MVVYSSCLANLNLGSECLMNRTHLGDLHESLSLIFGQLAEEGYLHVWSRSGLGTEVELRVPTSMAYRRYREAHSTWLRPGKRV